jgi:hypothetical protein
VPNYSLNGKPGKKRTAVHRWLWVSRAYPVLGSRPFDVSDGFIFSQRVTRNEAAKLIREYWDIPRLPTGFKLLYVSRYTIWTFHPENIKNVAGGAITMNPIQLKNQ